MNELGIVLFWCVAQVTLLGMVAGALYGGARRFGPATGAHVALLALVLFSALTVGAFSPWPNWLGTAEARVTGEPVTEPEVRGSGRAGSVTEPLPAEAGPQGPPRELANREFPWQHAAQAFWRELRAPQAEADSFFGLWPGLLVLVVGAGALLGLVRLVLGVVSVAAYRRHSRPLADASLQELLDVLAAQLSCKKAIALYECPRLSGAATIGWRRPWILLPPAWRHWNEEERRAVLAHELVHVARNDYLTWLTAQLGLTLHFYHPLAHWLCGCLRLDQELVADSVAARLSGGQQIYLQSLARIALQQADAPLSWPARTFLPTRRTFLRRIEMLREPTTWRSSAPRSLRWLAASVLLTTSLTVSGFRSSGVTGSAALLAQQPAAAKEQAQKPLGLAYVPRDAIIVAAVRPATLSQQKVLQPLAKLLAEFELRERLAVLESAQFVLLSGGNGQPAPVFILRTTSPADLEGLAQWVAPHARPEERGGQTFYLGGSRLYVKANDRTLLVAQDESLLRRCAAAGVQGATSASWAKAWFEVAAGEAAALINMELLQPQLAADLQRLPEPARLQAAVFSPLWEKTWMVTARLDADESLQLLVKAFATNGDDARHVADTARAGRTLLQNLLRQWGEQIARDRVPDAEATAGLAKLSELLDQLQIDQAADHVTLAASLDEATLKQAVASLVPPIQAARQAARRAIGMNNLKQLALAFHNYHDTYTHFPPAVVMGPTGIPHSWRVELLPFLDHAELHRQYRMEEPWDSPHNRKVLAKMPAVFRNPEADPSSTNASYFVLTGPDTVFSGPQGIGVQQIRDGTSNTILLVEARRDIPWTQPEDIPYLDDQPLPKLGGWQANGFLAALCDGSAHFLADSLDPHKLRLMIKKADGQVVPR